MDHLRHDATKAIEELKRAGIERVVMLTGDNPLAAQAIARQLGVDEVHAELSPKDKTRKVVELEAKYGKVMVVGDGVNDVPTLAAAHVGVAMGAVGTDVALETEDVALRTTIRRAHPTSSDSASARGGNYPAKPRAFR